MTQVVHTPHPVAGALLALARQRRWRVAGSGPIARLPAGEIEALVLARLRSALQSDHEIMDRLGLASDAPALT